MEKVLGIEPRFGIQGRPVILVISRKKAPSCRREQKATCQCQRRRSYFTRGIRHRRAGTLNAFGHLSIIGKDESNMPPAGIERQTSGACPTVVCRANQVRYPAAGSKECPQPE